MGQDIGKSFTVGVDLGGTKMEAALIDTKGRVLSEKRYPTNPDKGSKRIIADLIDTINELQDQAGQKALAVGIGAAGQVDKAGVVRSAPNLPFHNEPLKTRLEKELRLPVVVTNDVHAATYGEWRYGAGKDVSDLVVLFVGTGIGGGIVSGGRILRGCSNTAGELGHITIVAEGRKCRCPNRGCLEAYAGGWAIAERAQEAADTGSKEAEQLISLAGGVEKITSFTVSQAFHEGDPFAKGLIEETSRYLAAGVVGIVNAFNPCMLVLGGGVIEGLPELIPRVEEIVRKRALKPSVEKLKIVKVALGGKAGVVGVAALAYNMVGERK